MTLLQKFSQNRVSSEKTLKAHLVLQFKWQGSTHSVREVENARVRVKGYERRTGARFGWLA